MSPVHRSRAARIVAAALVLLAITATYACAQKKSLSHPYAYLVGDDVATRMSGILRVVAGLEASTLVYYDRKDGRIVANVVGSASDVPGAERELDSFLQAVRQFVFPYAKRQHGLDLSDTDVTLVYYNDGGEGGAPYEVVRRENGAYKPAPGAATDGTSGSDSVNGAESSGGTD